MWVQDSRTGACNPPRIGAQIGERVIFLREDEEGVQEGAVDEEAQLRKEKIEKRGEGLGKRRKENRGFCGSDNQKAQGQDDNF